MVNEEIAQIFRNTADYLEMQDANFFRVRAYQKAADAVDNYPKNLAKLNIEQLKKIPGVGKSMAEHIVEYSKTGKMQHYEKLKETSPVKLEELTRIQGVGPKTVKKLYYKLDVKNVDELKKAAEEGKISKLDGFGERSQESILENIEFAVVNKERSRIDDALQVAEKYIDYMQEKDKSLQQINYGGSLRRRNETIGDVDLLVSSKKPKETTKIFINYPEIEKILGTGETKSSVWLKQKIQVDLRVIDNDSYGSALQYFTGSIDHNVLLRKIAIRKGLKLSEYGLFRKKDNEMIAGKTEKEIYEKLVNNYIEPELREDGVELDLAKQNTLPKLITLKDIKGDLQMHTNHSDGKNSMKDMIERCIALGYEYMGFTDHFGSLRIANSVKENEFNEYFDEIQKLKEGYKDKIKILAGGEINIKSDGTLDFKQELLEKLDFVVAGVHSALKQDAKTATERYLKALDNPVITIVAHPTGRLIQRRPGLEFNYTTVFAKAAEKGVAMEINAHPMRLDLSYGLVKVAVDQGCKIQISTDAHSVEDLDLMKYGVFVARKAGLEKKNLFCMH